MSYAAHLFLNREDRAELAWVNETPDPNKCGCRNLRSCEETGHRPGACAGAVATKFWTFRSEYYCAPRHEWCGTKARGYMTSTISGQLTQPAASVSGAF
jgi:hypothetical protein